MTDRDAVLDAIEEVLESGYAAGDGAEDQREYARQILAAVERHGLPVEPGVEATRVHAIKGTLLDAFSGPFTVRLPQALYDLAHGRVGR